MSKSIAQKLMDIQAQLNVPKNNYNSFGKYNYRSCEDIMEAVKPLCEKAKAVLVVSDTMEQVGGRVYVKATATLHDCESDASICNSAYAREAETKKGMDDSQVTGTASSYARKYALGGLFCIDDVKDADTRDNRNEPQAAPPPQAPRNVDDQAVTKDQVEHIKKECQARCVDPVAICRMYNKEQFAQFTQKQFRHLMANWEEVARRVSA